MGLMERTPREFWAVTAVTTDAPWTPPTAKALRSAWMPAPPELSDPATVKTTGAICFMALQWVGADKRVPTPTFTHPIPLPPEHPPIGSIYTVPTVEWEVMT